MTNEEIALELVKAWCMQPSTAAHCFKMWEVLNSYKEALEKLEEIRKDGHDTTNELACGEAEEESFEETDRLGKYENVEDYEKKFRSLKCNFQGVDWDEVKEKLKKGV